MYTVLRDGSELLAYHWHPEVPSRYRDPHLHARLATLEDFRPHLPTGLVLLEDVIAFLITELGARPLRDDWEIVLAEARGRAREWAAWA